VMENDSFYVLLTNSCLIGLGLSAFGTTFSVSLVI